MSDENDIAKFFVAKTGLPATKHLMSRINVDARALLQDGYTRENLIDAITFTVDVKNIKMYSFGFIVTQIHKIMHDMKIHIELQKVKSFKHVPKVEVEDDGKSGERNRAKLNRFGAKPRFGEEFDLHMLKES